MKKNKTVIIFTLITLMLMGTIVYSFAETVFDNCISTPYFQYGDIDNAFIFPSLSFDNNITVNLYLGETSTEVNLIAINGNIFLTNDNGKHYYFYPEFDNNGNINGIRVALTSNLLTDDKLYADNTYLILRLNNLGFIVVPSGLNYTTVNKIINQLGIVADGNSSLYSSAQVIEGFTICNIIERSPPYMAIIIAILEIFTGVGNWFVEIIPDILGIFWDVTANSGEGALTILGALAVASLAVAIILLVLRWVVNFFKFRG